MTALRCVDCDRVEPRVSWSDAAQATICLDCFEARYPGEIDLDTQPVRLEKVDGRYSAHDRRYGARRQDFANLLARAELEPPYRVRPLAVDGHLTVLAATGGDGKTWLGFGMAAGVAYGTAVAGMDCAQGRSVIFDAENGPWVLGSRMKALEDGMPADRVAIYDAEGLRLSDTEDRAWMLGIIRTERANLVIIDALRPLAPDAEENSSDAMAPVVIGAKQLARDSGAAVVLIHHRGNDGARDFRGSTAIRDQTDLLFVLEREEKDPERKWRRRLRCAKCRIAAEPEDRWFGIRGNRGYVTLTEAAPYQPGGVKGDVAREVLEVLAVASSPLRLKQIAEEIGRPPKDGTLRRALEDLQGARQVVATGDGYSLPNPGAKAAGTALAPGTQPTGARCHLRSSGTHGTGTDTDDLERVA